MKPMRTSMTYPIRFWALLLAALLIYQFSTDALADSCKYEKIIDTTLDLTGSEVLTIAATAGDLEIIGVDVSDQAIIHGRVCVSKESWLEKSEINTTTGKRAAIEVSLPDADGGWTSFGNSYAWIDLHIEVPQDITLNVKDSSGDMELTNTASVEIQDSSGDIEIEKARGPVYISDSSGDIEIDGSEGDVTIESDSSGDIEAEDINGSVLVMSDSSGDIEATDISGDFIVERDSSGDINADDVGGDFRVLKDGSGSISSSDVKGEIDIPEKD